MPRIDGPPSNLTPPKGYDGLAVAIIDAIWSIGVRYDSVTVPVLDRYRRWSREIRSSDPNIRTPTELISDIDSVGGPDAFATQVVTNQNRTSSKNGVLKAEAVYKAALALREFGINTPDDLAKVVEDPRVKEWQAVPGQSSGLT